MSESIVIGFGGNVGIVAAIRERFADARQALSELGEIKAALLYRSAPIGPAQPDYLNTAVLLTAAGDLAPDSLLARLHAIEIEHGRRRDLEPRFGPRTLDLDLLVWGARTLHTGELVLPHPRLAERRFALQPLIDVVGPQFEIAGAGRAGDLLAKVVDQQLEQLGAW
jgi:2-amino-4-hydroxy-6-hydroxymethyldihydropteridine diphosphokinase